MIQPNIITINSTDVASAYNRMCAIDSSKKLNVEGLLPVTVEFITKNKWVPTTLILLVPLVPVFTKDHTIIQPLFTIFITAIAVLFVSLWSKHCTAYIQEIERLHRLAYLDELTGISNRRSILKHLEIAIHNQSTGWLLMIDLDGFKQVNDVHGHETGDKILKASADRLSQTLGDNIKLARLGGDEFLVLADDTQEVNNLIEDIKDRLNIPFAFNRACICIGASVGAVRLNKNSNNVSDLLRRADIAMYQDKSIRKAQSVENQMPNGVLALSAYTNR